MGRIACLVLVIVVALPAAAREVALGGGMWLSQQGEVVRLVVGGARVTLSLDGGCPGCQLSAARLVAGPPGGAIVIRATYASRRSQRQRQCGGGEEDVVHLVARWQVRHEAFAWRLASCWRSIEPFDGGGGLAWDRAMARLTLDRIVFEAGAAWRERRQWRLPPDGTVQEEGSLRRELSP